MKPTRTQNLLAAVLAGLTTPKKAPAPGRLAETPDSQCSKSAENGCKFIFLPPRSTGGQSLTFNVKRYTLLT